MRLSLLSLLLLTAAGPALAAQSASADPAEQSNEREVVSARFDQAPRGGRQMREGSEAQRPRAFERAGRVERVERSQRYEPQAAAPPPEPVSAAPRAAPDRRRGEWSRNAAPPGAASRPGPDSAADGWRGSEGGERRTRNRDLPPSAGSPVYGSSVVTPETLARPRGDVATNSAIPPAQPSARDLRGRIAAEGVRRDRIESESWRREWRQDRRYDWRRHRNYDRTRFRVGIYYDPFGWGYRDWDIGWRLPSRYYSSRYWIHDPWYYRLPPVGGQYRWVRYFNDVLLVDLRTGRVLDRIPRFFW